MIKRNDSDVCIIIIISSDDEMPVMQRRKRMKTEIKTEAVDGRDSIMITSDSDDDITERSHAWRC